MANDSMTESRYDEEVRIRAEDAVQSASDSVGQPPSEEALDETVSDIVEHHQWFARSHYDIHLYASIIKHTHTDEEDLPHSDWKHRVVEQADATAGIKQMAKDFFEQDIWSEALEQLPEGTVPLQ